MMCAADQRLSMHPLTHSQNAYARDSAAAKVLHQACMPCYQQCCCRCCSALNLYKLCTLSEAAAAGAHWVKEDEDEVHMVGHPHDAVFDWKGVLPRQRQTSKAGMSGALEEGQQGTAGTQL
jgi:hypothetical protein